jgi:hypothetical protein
MKNYLRQTNGKLANDKREAWEIKAVHKMVCPNNHAERPFAVLKALAQMYPSLSLRNLPCQGWSIPSLTELTGVLILLGSGI